MTSLLFHIGRYFAFLVAAFRRPRKVRVFGRALAAELEMIGLQSLGIVVLLSLFMGAVIAIQTAHQIGGWIPAYTIGFAVRQTMILEFAPTIIPVILSGKVGSNIASQIGTMRVSEQIDALEVMGVAAISHLALPKILAGVIIFPFLVIIAMVLGIGAGAWISVAADLSSMSDFQYGMQIDFAQYDVMYALFKTTVFAAIITSVSAYHGFYTSGGALEVGRSSTKAVVYSVVLIMITNLVITQLLLT
ncbi:MAG: ABC transporter permease [Flavobacteriales bacterium]|nr:ABC transporter permease [Flavobacteriales bacterium]